MKLEQLHVWCTMLIIISMCAKSKHLPNIYYIIYIFYTAENVWDISAEFHEGEIPSTKCKEVGQHLWHGELVSSRSFNLCGLWRERVKGAVEGAGVPCEMWDVQCCEVCTQSHVGHGKVNSNCFNNSETITTYMAMIDVAAFDVCFTQEWFVCNAQIYTSREGLELA